MQTIEKHLALLLQKDSVTFPAQEKMIKDDFEHDLANCINNRTTGEVQVQFVINYLTALTDLKASRPFTVIVKETQNHSWVCTHYVRICSQKDLERSASLV